MPTDVLMPQMGESIAEGTIVRWVKQVGDSVERDEPLFEISTDKVDAEIPAPVAGVLAQIRAGVGETVPVNSVVAVIGNQGEVIAPEPARTAPATPGAATPTDSGGPTLEPPPSPSTPASRRLSPLVRRLLAEHGIDASRVSGTGESGRVTRADVLAHVARRDTGVDDPDGPGATVPAFGERAEPLGVMRRRIAERMVASRRTAAHVHTVFDVDFSRVAARRATGDGATRAVGYLAHIAKAVCGALMALPRVNASLDGDRVLHRGRVDLGIAVALEWGLIVPVIKAADALSVEEIDIAITDLSTRARAKQLSPDDVDGGTFTITNPGMFGSVFGLPIINQPQSAILCVGVIEKRPVVVDDMVVARLQSYLTLGFDHRLIDGAVADRFMAHVRDTLEERSS